MINRSIYPIIGYERELPFYLIGVGYNDWQFDLDRPNGYPNYQIIFCTRGKGRLIFDGKEYIITPNVCFYLPAFYPHAYYTVGNLWETHWIAFDGSAVKSTLETLGFKKAMVMTLDDITKMEYIYQKIYSTMKTDTAAGSITCSGLIYQFALEMHKEVYGKNIILETNKNHMLMHVLAYIDEHYTEDIELRTLCEIAKISPQHLCRIFKRVLTVRPLEYITGKRLQRAKELLIYTNDDVKDIALRVGYENNSYFNTVFKKSEGVPPLEFRRVRR